MPNGGKRGGGRPRRSFWQRLQGVPFPELGLKWPPVEPIDRAFIKAVLAEFACTWAFLFITIGHACFSCHCIDTGLLGQDNEGWVAHPHGCALTTARLLSIATVFGLTIGVLVYAAASFSGGHLNPAITLGNLIARKITAQRAVFYWGAQICGAMLGSLFPWLIDRDGWHAADGAVNRVFDGIEEVAVWAMEALLTMILVFVVFAANDSRRVALAAHLPVLAPFAIGYTISVCHLIAVPIDNCSVNPARSFGPAVIGGDFPDHYIFWVGPLAGGAWGAIVYEVFFREWFPRKPPPPAEVPPVQLPAYSGIRGQQTDAMLEPGQVHFAAYAGPQGAVEAPPGVNRRAAAAEAAARAEGFGPQRAAAAGDAAV